MTVLDASAVIGLLRREPAAPEVLDLLRERTVLTAVNLGEVVDRLVRLDRRDPDQVRADTTLLHRAGTVLTAVDAELGIAAGRLRAKHYRRSGADISLADCIAAATALANDLPLATADRVLTALVRAEGGTVVALPNNRGVRP